MQLEDIRANVADQDRGRPLHIVEPFTGERTGMIFTVAGPDSDTAQRARLRLGDELADAADAEGRVSAENREIARRNHLAAHVLRWEGVEEGGNAVLFNTKNLLALLRVGWIAAQVDAFAGDRRNYRPEA